MAIQTMIATINGTTPLLMNNPQTVDRFNKYARRMAEINAKKTRRTDDDYLELQDLEVRSKIYWDDELGIYVPDRWVMAGMAKVSNKVAKVPKADIRASVFTTADKYKLTYDGMKKIKTPKDIVGMDQFRHKMLLPQGQVRIAKAMPIFQDWSFSFELEFETTVIDPDSLRRIIEHMARYGGFGDFRPSFGRATAEVQCDALRKAA